jgi:hypothetical protein
MFATGVGMGRVPGDERIGSELFPRSITGDRRQYGLQLIRAYNQWAMRTAGVSSRVRAVLPLIADDVPALIAGAEMIDHGIRGIWLPSSELPAGRSPAHSDLDAFWQLMTDNDITVCLHIGADQPLRSREWGNAPVFSGFRLSNSASIPGRSASIT